MNIIEAINDPRFFLPLFKNLNTWKFWLVLLKAIFGLPMEDLAERQVLAEYTGLSVPPDCQANEAYIIAGRRSGKSYMASIIAVYLATFRDWRPYLSQGEKGWIFIIATDKDQAKIIKRYISGILNSNPAFRKTVAKELEWEIELENSVNIAVKTCNFRSLRGFTVLAAICEEIAFWRDENSANPAQEVLAALRPALATIPDSMLIGISTPYSRSGVLWEQYRTHYGKENGGSPLIWRAPTRIMNPTVHIRRIENDLREDYTRARAEWDAEFREDVETFLSLEQIEAAVVLGRFELPRIQNAQYSGFIDPSGGRQDSFTLAISHREESGKIVLDCIREVRPPFQPQAVVLEFSDVLKSYSISYIESDKYAAEWVVAEFGKHGIVVENSKLSSSEIYLNFLPLVMNGSVDLLENRRLIEQLSGLERRARAGGRDLVSHGQYPGAHDDVAIVCAGACVLANSKGNHIRDEIQFGEPYYEESLEEKLERESRDWLLDRKPKEREGDMEDQEDIESEAKIHAIISRGW